MPTRKQRRRRQKERRHEYEYVYVDEEGREVEVDSDEADADASRRNGKRDTTKEKPKPKPARSSKQDRPVRPVSPPSWGRVVKRAALFGPLIFIAFTLINSGQPLAGRLAVAAAYTAFFVPLMYLMDRTMYRSYLRRTGQQAPRRPARKR